MYFGVAPSAYRSVHATPIFRSFEPSPWHVAAWKWLLEKHPIARQAFCAIGYRLRIFQKSLQLTVLNLSGPIFTLLVSGQNCRHWTGETNLCTLFPIKHCLHRPPQASMRFGSRFLQIETEKHSFPHMLFFKQKTRHDYERKSVCCCIKLLMMCTG